jgi:adenylate cyclase
METHSKVPDIAGRAPGDRKLIAIFYADMVAYSRLIGFDDIGTVLRLQALRRALIDPAIRDHGGRIIQTGGDSLLAAFDSIDGAVRCGIKLQREIPLHDGDQPPDRRIRFRIGINIGDVIANGSDVYGDGVNVAARLEAVCPVGGVCVSRAVRDHVRDRDDLPFEELGALTLKNIARPIEAFVLRIEPQDTASAPLVPYPSAAAVTRPDKPSLAVLPFTNMDGDPDQEYFSHGMAEDIITTLSRSRSLFVIARNSSFTYGGRAVDVRQIARDLGVRYVHEGSVRRSGERVRVNAQLIDAETGNHLWAERYDQNLTDMFVVQDEITNSVALAIQPAIARAEQKRAMYRSHGTLGAWENYQRGLWHRTNGGVAANEQARSFFRRAIDLDPTFSPPNYSMAHSYFDDAMLYYKRTFTEAAILAEPFARRAAALDPDDAEAYAVLALVSAAQGDTASELARAEQAIALNSNCVLAHRVRGVCLVCMGRQAEGTQTLLASLRLSPRDPRNRWIWNTLPLAYYLLGDYESTVETASRAPSAYNPVGISGLGGALAYRCLAAALGQLGRVEEAQDVMRQAAAAVAPVSFDDYARRPYPWMRPEDHAMILDGLSKAGWQG